MFDTWMKGGQYWGYLNQQKNCAASIYYLNKLEPSIENNVQWGRIFQESSSVEWLDNRMKQLEKENEQLQGIFTGLVSSFLHFSNNSTYRALENVIKKLHHFQFVNHDEMVRFINLLAFNFGGDESRHR